MPNILILPTIYVFYTISGYRRYKIIVFWRSRARWGYRGAFCSACWVQWHWEHPFTHLKLFYFPNVIGLVQRIESFGLNAYQTESLVPNGSIRIWEWKKWSESDIRPSIVTHTRNSCSTFTHPSAHTHSSEHTHIYIYAFRRHFYPKRLTVHSGYTFCQYACSLGIEPTTFCATNAMLYHWATGTHPPRKQLGVQQQKIQMRPQSWY